MKQKEEKKFRNRRKEKNAGNDKGWITLKKGMPREREEEGRKSEMTDRRLVIRRTTETK